MDRKLEPNFASEQALAYLDGSLPGDLGFDPLGLSEPSTGEAGFTNAKWLAYSEVGCMHASLVLTARRPAGLQPASGPTAPASRRAYSLPAAALPLPARR